MLLNRSIAPLISIIGPNGEIQRVKAEKFFSKIEKLGKIQNGGVATLMKKYLIFFPQKKAVAFRGGHQGVQP